MLSLSSSAFYVKASEVGHAHARQKTIEAAKRSSTDLDETYKNLLKAVISGKYTVDAEHNKNTVQLLEDEHKAWSQYRDYHCQLETNIYTYPERSKLSIHEFNSCLLRLNKKRKKYLEGLKYEFNQ